MPKKPIKEIICELIEEIPVSHDKTGVPYIRISDFNQFARLIKEGDFGGCDYKQPHLYLDRELGKIETSFSYMIAYDAEKYAKKLSTKYQKKIDRFIKKKYKMLKKFKKGGTNE